MIIYILNILHKSISKKTNKKETVPMGQSLMNDAGYISNFAEIKKSNTISEINSKLSNLFSIFEKYKVSVNDTFAMLEEIIGNKYNRWIIDEVYNYNGKYNINDLNLSRYIGKLLYANGDTHSSIDEIYKNCISLRRVILDSVFNKIKEDNKNNIIEELYDVS